MRRSSVPLALRFGSVVIKSQLWFRRRQKKVQKSRIFGQAGFSPKVAEISANQSAPNFRSCGERRPSQVPKIPRRKIPATPTWFCRGERKVRKITDFRAGRARPDFHRKSPKFPRTKARQTFDPAAKGDPPRYLKSLAEGSPPRPRGFADAREKCEKSRIFGEAGFSPKVAEISTNQSAPNFRSCGARRPSQVPKSPRRKISVSPAWFRRRERKVRKINDFSSKIGLSPEKMRKFQSFEFPRNFAPVLSPIPVRIREKLSRVDPLRVVRKRRCASFDNPQHAGGN